MYLHCSTRYQSELRWYCYDLNWYNVLIIFFFVPTTRRWFTGTTFNSILTSTLLYKILRMIYTLDIQLYCNIIYQGKRRWYSPSLRSNKLLVKFTTPPKSIQMALCQILFQSKQILNLISFYLTIWYLTYSQAIWLLLKANGGDTCTKFWDMPTSIKYIKYFDSAFR